LVIGISVSDFHQAWPWSQLRWDFVEQRMADLVALRWHGSAQALQSALAHAQGVRCVADPHMERYLPPGVASASAAPLFAPVDGLCGSFSKWWKHAALG
jgi:deoxyribodipyrimidine photo-lyase